ncbi:glucocorticoid modulatory element-binding protein 1 isoform X2 [Cynoglossus semilaevis]|uniref:Glucocorticoid modulatory element binding protein 1 n=1 Tax=Cynoglossus semilaevis TaxID=244447 RepID=A0A3P8V5U3_CYNSE|nr:glucocorticoid modulatory element-binding protein 1 isoform X2 [Cynoglossus semilaevis]
MAGAEVTVSSGEHMKVKGEERESSGINHGTQVILHLQPVLNGVKAGIAGSGSTILAVETHQDDSEADGEVIEYGYPITCGDSRAVLLFKKFVCPGINVPCVKFNNQLISPKQFVHIAGKATLKDWKRAIRLGGVMLRKMMDSGQIDFYQHDTVCSNTCRSTKLDVLINSSRLPPGMSTQPNLSSLALDPPGGQVPPLTEMVNDAAEVEENETAEWSPGAARPLATNGHAAKRTRADTPDGVLSLWNDVADLGLMGDVLSSLQTELLATLEGVDVRSGRGGLQETDAVILNSLCKMFGLLDSVKRALDLRRSRSEESRTHDGAEVFSESWEERQTPGGDKSTYNCTSSKRLQSEGHNQDVLSSVKTNQRIQALAVPPGLSASSHAQLSVHPQYFTHVFVSSDQHQHGRTGKMDRKRRHGLNDRRRSQEQVQKHNTSGSYEVAGLRGGLHPDIHESPEVETRDFHDFGRVMTERTSSKKHKSKRE